MQPIRVEIGYELRWMVGSIIPTHRWLRGMEESPHAEASREEVMNATGLTSMHVTVPMESSHSVDARRCLNTRCGVYKSPLVSYFLYAPSLFSHSVSPSRFCFLALLLPPFPIHPCDMQRISESEDSDYIPSDPPSSEDHYHPEDHVSDTGIFAVLAMILSRHQ